MRWTEHVAQIRERVGGRTRWKRIHVTKVHILNYCRYRSCDELGLSVK
jgi:hypothetical protein